MLAINSRVNYDNDTQQIYRGIYTSNDGQQFGIWEVVKSKYLPEGCTYFAGLPEEADDGFVVSEN